jgi:arylsulfatase A-like enzyme
MGMGNRCAFTRGTGLSAWCAGAALVLGAGAASAGGQPNILLIISDDAGWADFGFNDQGNGQIPTPALDSIAARGRWFRAAYTAPVCSPSRARIFLGQHGQRTGYDHNGPDDQSASNAVVEGLTLGDVTMFERLNDAGTRSGSSASGTWEPSVTWSAATRW